MFWDTIDCLAAGKKEKKSQNKKIEKCELHVSDPEPKRQIFGSGWKFRLLVTPTSQHCCTYEWSMNCSGVEETVLTVLRGYSKFHEIKGRNITFDRWANYHWYLSQELVSDLIDKLFNTPTFVLKVLAFQIHWQFSNQVDFT